MCVRTQLAPSAQTLQVGETSTIRRGSPEVVVGLAAFLPPLPPAAKSVNAIANTASRLVGARVSSS